VREVGGRGCSSSGARRTGLGARAGEGRAAPGLALGGPSLPLLSPPPRACPSRSGGAVSPPRVSGALSIVSAFTTGSRGGGRRAGAGPPHPRLSWGRLPSSGCACLRLLLFSSGANSPAEQPPSVPDPSLWAPGLCPRCRLSSACGNDVRIGGSKFFTCLGGLPIFFLGNQIVLIPLISKCEAAAEGTNVIFPLDSENLFDFYFYF